MSKVKNKRNKNKTSSVKKHTTFKTESSVKSETIETAIIVSELYRHIINGFNSINYNISMRKFLKNQYGVYEKSVFVPVTELSHALNTYSLETKRSSNLSLDDLPENWKRLTFLYQLDVNTIEQFNDVESKRVVEYAVNFTCYQDKVLLRVAKRLMDGGWYCDYLSYELQPNFIEQYLNKQQITISLLTSFDDCYLPSNEFIMQSICRWIGLLTDAMYLFKVSNLKSKVVKRLYSYSGYQCAISVEEASIFYHEEAVKAS